MTPNSGEPSNPRNGAPTGLTQTPNFVARWVAPAGATIPRTTRGFLDLDATRTSRYTDAQPISVDDLVNLPASFAVLAPAGLGKSTLLRDLAHRETAAGANGSDNPSDPRSRIIDLSLEDRTTVRAIVGEKLRSAPEGVLYLDTLDQAVQRDRTFGRALVAALSTPEAHARRWRIVCRPGAWNNALSSSLREALTDFTVYELLPLDPSAYLSLAAAAANANRFVAATHEAGLDRLCANPMRAGQLIDQWNADQTLPVDRADAMGYTVRRLISEHDQYREVSALGTEQLIVLAQRLAATTVFCGLSGYFPGPDRTLDAPNRPPTGEATHSGAAVSITALPFDPEPDLGPAPVSPTDLAAVIHTGLYSTSSGGALGAVHQSYDEYLTAEYLKRRGVTGERLVALLGAEANGMVAGSMVEVLGWLLAVDADVPPQLIHDNAKQLLRTESLEAASNTARGQLVTGLLEAAASGWVLEGWGVNASALTHPGLANQLNAAARSPANRWVVSWICRIARDCRVAGTAQVLLRFAFDPKLDDNVRAEAVDALSAVTEPSEPGAPVFDLLPLLELEATDDPHDEIHAAALRALVVHGMAVSDIVTHLRPRRDTNFIGNYAVLLGDLASLITPANALDMLETMLPTLDLDLRSGARTYARLTEGLVRRAFQPDDDVSLRRLGRIFDGKSVAVEDVANTTEPLPWLEPEQVVARRKTAAAALLSANEAPIAARRVALVNPGDIGWLLGWLPTVPEPDRAGGLWILGNLLNSTPDAATADLVLAVTPDHVAYGVVAAFHGSQPLSSRPDWHSFRIATPTVEQIDTARVRIHVAADDPASWFDAFMAVSCDWVYVHQFEWRDFDLTRRPVWRFLDDEDQNLFLTSGMAFLATQGPSGESPRRRAPVNQTALHHDWAVIHLLGTLVEHRPGRFGQLADQTLTRWAPAIVAFPSTDPHRDLWLKDVYGLAPSGAKAAMESALADLVADTDPSWLTSHWLADLKFEPVLAALRNVASDSGVHMPRRDQSLRLMRRYWPHEALAVARDLESRGQAVPSAQAIIAAADPEGTYAKWVASNTVGPLEHLLDLNPTDLSNTVLTGLTRLLYQADLGSQSDIDESEWFSRTTPATNAIRLRQDMLREMAGRGLVAEIRGLNQLLDRADRNHASFLLQNARAVEAVERWAPLTPDTLMGLAGQTDARLIRDAAGLSVVLLEQLGHLQHDLRTGQHRFLWNGTPGQPDAQPKSEDDISDWVSDRLNERLRSHVVVDREVQVARRKQTGVGTRIDLTATSGGTAIGRVLFEAKLVTNDTLRTAIDDQLINRYLEPLKLTEGIYLVYWMDGSLRTKHRTRDLDAQELRTTLQELANRYAPERHIVVFVLDISPPEAAK
ncbi:hypothetical protein [Nocardioides sp. 1609]|uniref:hypothetical protein n=1 Tax=Nocardioides sp. 1609 TaxID=2508327 RepID=UPI00106F8606|nr:hypothetical protein [Nocardioides sp. 1609]